MSTSNTLDDLFETNGVNFVGPDQNGALFDISYATIYEFYILSDGHPFHIHVNPFQVQQDLLSGYIAKRGDWMDTLGYRELSDVKTDYAIRMNTQDFVGNVVVHCYFLSHKDLGMMGFMKIVNGPTNDFNYCAQMYGFNRQQQLLTMPSFWVRISLVLFINVSIWLFIYLCYVGFHRIKYCCNCKRANKNNESDLKDVEQDALIS